MVGIPRILLAALCLSTIGVPAVQGIEPSGHVVFDVAPVEASSEQRSLRLRLIVRTVSPLAGVELRTEAPRGVRVVPLPAPDSSLPPRSADDVLLLGDLERGRTVAIDFEFVLAPGIGGPASFTITGRLPDGRSIREAVGWTLAPAAPGPTRRFGAAEYPAVVIPETGP